METPNTENVNWEFQKELGFQKHIIEPILVALKKTVEAERDELLYKLNNLKRLGLISMDKDELNKHLEALKVKKSS